MYIVEKMCYTMYIVKIGQLKYNKFLTKKEGEREMTKKEKEIFNRFRDEATSKYIESLNSGDNTREGQSFGEFIILNRLWHELNRMME